MGRTARTFRLAVLLSGGSRATVSGAGLKYAARPFQLVGCRDRPSAHSKSSVGDMLRCDRALPSQVKLRCCLKALIALLIAPISLAQNRLLNGSFESDGAGQLVTCTNGGEVPYPWTTGTFGSDTYSTNCGQIPGLAPSTNTNFAANTYAIHGQRFASAISGSSREYLKQTLSTPLTPGVTYTLSGFFLRAPNFVAGSYRVFLVGSQSVLIGAIGGAAVTGGNWTFEALTFVAPSNAGSLPSLSLVPSVVPMWFSYTACDDLVLEQAQNATPVVYCLSVPNSTGASGHLAATGSSSLAANDLVLLGSSCPASVAAIVFCGKAQTQVSFGNGVRCVAAPLSRLALLATDSTGAFSLPIDLTSMPFAAGAGTQWFLQAWHRDPSAGGAATNTTDGVHVLIAI